MCKAYRTVSLNSALLLAGMLPLDLRVREAASLYETRRGVPQAVLGDREVERVASATGSPHPARRIDLEFVSLADREQVDASANLEVKIFTDGSKMDGRVGAALSIWRGDAEARSIKLALPDYCTVYQAELLAICRATREIRKCPASSFGVYSDSMAALQTVKNHSCLHPLAVEARDNLTYVSHQNKVVNLFWIKAHAGFEGNERADQLAKEAAMNSKRKPDYELCPVSFIKRHIRMVTLDEWSRRYAAGQTASITKMFFPDAVAAYRTIKKIQVNPTLTQIMTGHGGFSEYLHRFKCKGNPSCICDPGVNETVPHLLLDCPVYATERFELENKMDVKLERGSIWEIISGKERQEFLKYCIKICSKVIERNKSV